MNSILLFFSFKIEFKRSFHTVEKALIGGIDCAYKIQLIKRTIQKGVFEKISIDAYPYEIKRLSNGHFISNNWGSVTLFDESFNQLKKIDIKGDLFGCAIHDDEGIYLTDGDNHCIYLMDNELNIIKTFGSEGDDMDQFDHPCTIICQNDYLFVSDWFNKRIQILTLDLKYLDTIQLDFDPESIAVSKTTIGINGSMVSGIFFYDIKTKKMKKEYRNINGRIVLLILIFGNIPFQSI